MFAKNVSALAIAFAITASSAYAAPSPALQADDQAINAACSADAAASGCTGKQVGTGLMKCMHAYKKATPAFKFSDSCKSAMQKRRADKKSGR